jgi:nitrogen regulatory protein PII 2
MKEIIAIIRPKKVEHTKDELEKLGIVSLTAEPVLGRGRQRGIAAEVGYDISSELLSKGKSGGMKYIPKRMLTIVVLDSEVDSVVNAIMDINRTAQIGDGKIFICPVEDAVRVRTDESGEKALM